MRFLRSMIAWLLISLGLAALGLWASAKFIVNTVDDGSVVSGFASTVLHQPSIQTLITDQAMALVVSELSENGVSIAGTPEEQILRSAVAATVGSEAFIDDLIGLFEQLEESIVAQLTDDTLPAGPLVISLDISEPLLAALAATPELASLVPPTGLDPVTFTALDEADVAHARSGYNGVEWLAAWALWIGLALILVGFIVLPSKRWIIPKFFLYTGLVALGAYFLARWLVMEEFVTRLPGGAEGETGSMLSDLVPQETVDRIQSGLLKATIVLLVLAVLAYWLVWSMFRGRDKGPRERRKGSERRVDDAEVPAPEVRTPFTTPAPSSLEPTGAVVPAGPVTTSATPGEAIPAPGSSASDVWVDGDTVIFGMPDEASTAAPNSASPFVATPDDPDVTPSAPSAGPRT